MYLLTENIKIFNRNEDKTILLQEHFHNAYEMIIVLDGQSKFEINHKTYLVEPFSLIFLNQFESHKMQVLKTPYKTIYIIIKPEVIKLLLDDPILFSIFHYRPNTFNHVIQIVAQKKQIYDLIQKLNQEYEEDSDMAYIAFKGIFQYLFVLLYRYYHHHFQNIEAKHQDIINIQYYIDEHYLEDIGLSQLAKQFYVSPAYLSRLFKEIIGYNLLDYIILLRLSKAKTLLKNTQLSITKLSSESGFHNVSHFIRTFKKENSMTPIQFRQYIRRNENK